MVPLSAKTVLTAAALLAVGCAVPTAKSPRPLSVTLQDAGRNRAVPIVMTRGAHPERCSQLKRCPVAVISGGYGISSTEYTFIVRLLSESDYTVVSIQHDLPGDAPLATDGDLLSLRMPVWVRGAQNIQFVRRSLAPQEPQLDFDQLLLIGHSNGGDLSLLFAQQYPGVTAAVITLDHRRLPIPLTRAFRILSLRSSDMEPIPGVVPSAADQAAFGIAIRQLSDARHEEMYDGGRESVKTQISKAIIEFLSRTAHH